MTIQTIARDNAILRVAGDIFPSATARLSLALRRRKAYNRTSAELSACSDRDLNDLGIARTDIPRLARDAANDAA